MTCDPAATPQPQRSLMHESASDSPSGAASGNPVGLSPDCESSLDAIVAHVQRHIGTIAYVWHEQVSTIVHVDVHVVFPTEERPFYTLVTSGMSDLPMTVPQEVETPPYAELLIRLPADWNLDYETLNDERNYWPIRLLQSLARFPHATESWLDLGFALPNGLPPRPFAPDTDLCAAMTAFPYVEGEAFHVLEARPGKTIRFFAVMPLFASEMRFLREQGPEELEKRFEQAETSLIVDPKRAPAV
jgi:hypothetical protein